MLQNSEKIDPGAFSQQVLEFGKEIFEEIGNQQPSAYSKNYWSGKAMAFSMERPELKTNLFRLVDVLPALRNSRAIASHVQEYLSDSAKEISGILEWGVNARPGSVRGRVTSMVTKKMVTEMARQFIAGETPAEALKPLRRIRGEGLAFTVDLLGEYCVSEPEALEYLERYREALEVFGKNVARWKESAPIIENHPGELSPICISVKLSALYSQAYPLNFKKSVEILSERLALLVREAKKLDAMLYVDAEDTAHNPIIFQVFEEVFGSREFLDFPYPGMVLQAYTREAEKRLESLLLLAQRRATPIAVRLVKGAYWDAETVLSAQNHWPSPLFSIKESSDANFEHLSRILIDHHEICLPAFGSHNIRSLAHACCYAEARGLSNKDFELQMLYGMAEPIARAFAQKGYLTRLYVPLGKLLPGMGYLVRRLLENTSNESFLKHTFVDSNEVEHLLREPQFRD